MIHRKEVLTNSLKIFELFNNLLILDPSENSLIHWKAFSLGAMQSTPWKILTEHKASIASFLVQTTRFIHRSSGFQCFFVDLGDSSALFSSSVVVPTFAHDHKGLAHTLEHLIFCGSRLHPEKGTLDQIANSFLSDGTNAHTAEDHTCYTFNTCHLEGLNRILPIFLDHIFFPTLGRNHFYTEVNHIVAEEGKLGGVVFCEMQARENSEADLCELAVKASLFGSESAYAMECGGKTGDIAEISLEQVVAFHKRFVCGNLSQRIDSILGSIDGFFGRGVEAKSTLECFSGEFAAKNTLESFNYEIQPNSAHSICNSTAKKINFPAAEEESVGSIVFGWRGPQMLQLAEIHALDLMLKFLNENAFFNKLLLNSKNHWLQELGMTFTLSFQPPASPFPSRSSNGRFRKNTV